MSLWNPWHGCHKWSAGCMNCYIYRMDSKHGVDSSLVVKTKSFDLPVRKKRNGDYKVGAGEIVYTCFSSDFFVEDADEWRDEAWKMIRNRPDLHFLMITKRIHRLQAVIPDDWGEGYANVTICCTIENQACADYRLPIYRAAPIKHKMIVCEPLLSAIDFSPHLGDWVELVMVGGESGNTARTCHYDWVLGIRRQCVEHGIPFHFRQTGARLLKDGQLYRIRRQFQFSQARKAGIDYQYKAGL